MQINEELFRLRMYLYSDAEWALLSNEERQEIECIVNILYCKDGTPNDMEELERKFFHHYYVDHPAWIRSFAVHHYTPPEKKYTWII